MRVRFARWRSLIDWPRVARWLPLPFIVVGAVYLATTVLTLAFLFVEWGGTTQVAAEVARDRATAPRVFGTGLVLRILFAAIALLASPTFTGVPTAPTATMATNTTQLATTAFVIANVSGAPSGSPTCGTGCSSIRGSNAHFNFTGGSSVTSIVVNFNGAWTSAPTCVTSAGNIGAATYTAEWYVTTTTGVLTWTLNAAASTGIIIDVSCGL